MWCLPNTPCRKKKKKTQLFTGMLQILGFSGSEGPRPHLLVLLHMFSWRSGSWKNETPMVNPQTKIQVLFPLRLTAWLTHPRSLCKSCMLNLLKKKLFQLLNFQIFSPMSRVHQFSAALAHRPCEVRSLPRLWTLDLVPWLPPRAQLQVVMVVSDVRRCVFTQENGGAFLHSMDVFGWCNIPNIKSGVD